MSQPGDPYAAQRGKRDRAELFRDDAGALNEYARRTYLAVLAGVFYLAKWRQLGAVEAGRVTCERFGHDPRGARCERCGAHVM